MVCKCFYERVTTYPFRRVQSKEPCLNRGWRSRQPLHVALFHEDIITLVQHERFFYDHYELMYQRPQGYSHSFLGYGHSRLRGGEQNRRSG